MKKVKVRIYKDPKGKGGFINPTKKFLQKAAAGMQVGQDMMSIEDRIIDELKSDTSAEDIADILEAEYGVKYYEALNLVDDVINYVYDDYANDIKNAELSDSELIPEEEEEPETVKKPPLYSIDEPWISEEDDEEGWDDFGEDSGEEDEEEDTEEEEEEEDLSSNKSKQPKSAQQQPQSSFDQLVNRQPTTGGGVDINKLFPNKLEQWMQYATPVNKKGGNVNKGKFVKNIVRGLHKAAEGVEQQANESSILDTPLKGREAHINNFRRGIKNLGNEFYAKQIYDQTKNLQNQVRSLPAMAQEGMQVESQDLENPMHHLQAYAGSVGNIFRQPMNQIHGAGYENLPEARKGREQRQAERQQRNMGRDFRRMFGDMAVGYAGVPGMPNYIQMITPQIQTGPGAPQGSSTQNTQANTGPFVDIEYKKGPWWTGRREWSAKGIPAEMMMGMIGGGGGRPGVYYGPGRTTSSSSWSRSWSSPGEIIREKVKTVNSKADPSKNNTTTLNNNPNTSNTTSTSTTYFDNKIPGLIDYGQDWAGNVAKSEEIYKDLHKKETLLTYPPEDPSQYGYMIDPATGEVVKNPKGTDVDQRGLVWSGKYDDENTGVDESLVWSNPMSAEEWEKQGTYDNEQSYIVTNPDGTQSSVMGIYPGSEFSPWNIKMEEATNARKKAADQQASYIAHIPKDVRAKNYKEINKGYGADILDANGNFTKDLESHFSLENNPVMDYPFATPSTVTTQTPNSSSQPQSNQANTQTQNNPQTQSNSQPSSSPEQKGSGDMTAEFTNLKNTGLGVLDQWDAYNEGLKGFSARVLGKGKVNGMIDDSRAKLQAVPPGDFCSQDIDGQIADIQAKKQEYANVLTAEDKGYLSQLESMLATAKGRCAQKQFGGPISGVGPDQYGNLQKFIYGGDEDIPISPIVAYDNNDIQSKNVDDPFMFRNGGLYKFQGTQNSETNPYNLTNPTPNAQTTNTVNQYQTPAFNRYNPKATSASNYSAFLNMKNAGLIQGNYDPTKTYDLEKTQQQQNQNQNQNQTQTQTQTQGGYYPTAPSPMRQIFDMFNPIKKDFTWLSQRDYPRTADGQIYNPQGQGQTQNQKAVIAGNTVELTPEQMQQQGIISKPQAGYMYDYKYEKGPWWSGKKTLTVSGKWVDPNNPNAGAAKPGSGNTQNNVSTNTTTNNATSNNTTPSNWHAPTVLPGTETQTTNATTTQDQSKSSSTTPGQSSSTTPTQQGAFPPGDPRGEYMKSQLTLPPKAPAPPEPMPAGFPANTSGPRLTEEDQMAYGGYVPTYMAYGGYVPKYVPGGQFSGTGPFDPNVSGIAGGGIGPCTEQQVLDAAPGDPCYNEGYSKGLPKDFSVKYDINDAKTLDLKATSRLKNLVGFGLRANANRKERNYSEDYLADNTTSDNREAANQLDYTGGYSGLNQRIMSKSGAGATGFNRVVGEAAFVKKGGELKYQRGGVYDLTQEEIGQILAAGGQIKFL